MAAEDEVWPTVTVVAGSNRVHYGGGALREASKMDPQPRPCFLSVDVHPRARLCSYRMIVIIWGGRPHEQVD